MILGFLKHALNLIVIVYIWRVYEECFLPLYERTIIHLKTAIRQYQVTRFRPNNCNINGIYATYYQFSPLK